MCGVLLTNRNPVTNETILDGWAESTSHDTECVTGTPCPTSVKNISFVTEWLRLGKSYREVSSLTLKYSTDDTMRYQSSNDTSSKKDTLGIACHP